MYAILEITIIFTYSNAVKRMFVNKYKELLINLINRIAVLCEELNYLNKAYYYSDYYKQAEYSDCNDKIKKQKERINRLIEETSKTSKLLFLRKLKEFSLNINIFTNFMIELDYTKSIASWCTEEFFKNIIYLYTQILERSQLVKLSIPEYEDYLNNEGNLHNLIFKIFLCIIIYNNKYISPEFVRSISYH